MPPAPGLQWPQFLLLQTWLPQQVVHTANANMVAWSLSVEVAFYLLFPIAAAIVGRQRDIVLLGAAGIIAILLLASDVASLTRSQDSAIQSFHLIPLPLLRLPEFLLGVALGEVYLRRRDEKPPVPLWVPALLLILLLCLTTSPFLSGWVALGSAVLIYCAACGGEDWLSRFLARPTLVLLGASSYALYLLHVSLIVMLSEFLSPMLRLILQLPVLIAISVGVLILVEEPARRWLRFWLGERPAT